MKKKSKITISILLILLSVIIFSLTAGVKIINHIYGLSHSPIPLKEFYKGLFCSDEPYYYNRVDIVYWCDDVEYRGHITDKEVINNLYKLSGELKIKQTIIDDTSKSYYQMCELQKKSFFLIEFKNENYEDFFHITNKQYVDYGEVTTSNFNRKEIVEGADELFDYLDTIGDYVE